MQKSYWQKKKRKQASCKCTEKVGLHRDEVSRGWRGWGGWGVGDALGVGEPVPVPVGHGRLLASDETIPPVQAGLKKAQEGLFQQNRLPREFPHPLLTPSRLHEGAR